MDGLKGKNGTEAEVGGGGCIINTKQQNENQGKFKNVRVQNTQRESLEREEKM